MRPYSIDFTGSLLTHQLQRVILIRDESRLMGYEDHIAESNSDYFAHLATWIDEVCLKLGKRNQGEIAKLQRIVDDLLYLYAHYEIKKKPAFRPPNRLKSRKS